MVFFHDNYIKHCYKNGAMDFDDILLFTFQYILIDEYQDTNYYH